MVGGDDRLLGPALAHDEGAEDGEEHEVEHEEVEAEEDDIVGVGEEGQVGRSWSGWM